MLSAAQVWPCVAVGDTHYTSLFFHVKILLGIIIEPSLDYAGQLDCGASEGKHIPCWQVWLEVVTSDAGTCLHLIGLPYVPGKPGSSLVIVTSLLAQVNDDFCDCMSGRDEPGTSACSQQGARFLCTDGKEAIPTSFLQDGFRYAWSSLPSIAEQAALAPITCRL